MPENFTGGKGSDRHPKQVCRKLMNQYSWTGTQPEFYEAVCRNADLELLASRCPKGFKPFLQRLHKLASILKEVAD
jgi:hypothetical protein